MFVAILLIIQMYTIIVLMAESDTSNFQRYRVVQAHTRTLGEVGIVGTVLLRVYSGRDSPSSFY